MTTVIKYFLLPAILFLSGSWQVSATSRQDDVAIAHTYSAQFALDAPQWELVLGQTVAVSSHHLPFSHSELLATESEVEEDKLVADEVLINTSNYFSAHFLARPNGYFIHCLKNSLPLSKHFSFSTIIRRNLLFQVFRI